jgi:hypothetical protein
MTPITYARVTYARADGNRVALLTASCAEPDQEHRIRTALGVDGGALPSVDDETLFQYYTYLSANLSLPFVACYPEPKTPREESQFRCTVVEILDPAKHFGDVWDGLFCKTRKGGFEVNLPLIELEVARGSRSFQLIDDYWYWFWNWR